MHVIHEEDAGSVFAVPPPCCFPKGSVIVRVSAERGHESGLVLRCPTHPAEAHPLPDRDGLGRLLEILCGIRRGEKLVGQNAMVIDLRQDLARLRRMERVVQPGDRACGVAEGRMGRDVLDPFAAEKDLAAVSQALQVLLAGHRTGRRLEDLCHRPFSLERSAPHHF
jgi:hypothetical protein